MAGKIKTLTLSHPYANPNTRSGDELYRVEKITDSIEFAPHQMLPKKEVESLCQSRDWKVTVVPNPNR